MVYWRILRIDPLWAIIVDNNTYRWICPVWDTFFVESPFFARLKGEAR